MEKPKRVAVVTYNRVGDGEYDSGVIRKNGLELFIAQNGHKSKWAASDGSWADRSQVRGRTAANVLSEIDLTEMDHTYLYVGASGGEQGIIETKEIPADKITYVMCGCNSSMKRNMIDMFGNRNAEIISAECGGQYTLGRIVDGLLNGK